LAGRLRDIRELVISSGRSGYVALYRLRNGLASVEILTLRHQREAGYRE
jgi:plasmid stabilization system protein ParE